MRDFKTKSIIILISAIMLVSGIINNVMPVYGSTDNELKTVSVAYFYDKNYFGNKYDSVEKEGFGYEYLQVIANYSGWRYKYVYGDYNTLLEQFLQGRIDIMPSLPLNYDTEKYYKDLLAKAKTQEKKDEIKKNEIKVLYPNQPMNSVDYYLCLPGGTNTEDFHISSLSGQKIAVPSIIYDKSKEWLDKEDLDPHNADEFDNTAACINALKRGDVKAIIAENNVAESGLVITQKMGSIDYYLGVSSKNRKLLKDINQSLDALSSSTSGFLKYLQSSYNSSGELEKVLSKKEKRWLELHDVLKVGALKNYPPYSNVDVETGINNGFLVEALPDILKNVNAEIEIGYQYYDNYEEMLTALMEGVVDVIFPVPTYLYISEVNNYISTDAIANTSMTIIYKGDFSEGTIADIAFPKQGLERYYDVINYPSSNLLLYNTVEECLDAVKDGTASCAILNDFAAENYSRYNRYKSLNYMVLPDLLGVGLGVKRGNTELYTLLTRGVSLSGENYQFDKHYLNASAEIMESQKGGIMSIISNEILIFTLIVMILLVILALVYSWAKKVQIASRQLKKANAEIVGIAEHQQQNFDVIGILARDYSSVYKVDLESEVVQAYRMEDNTDNSYGDMLRLGARYNEVFNQYVRESVFEDDKPKMYDEISIPVIRRKLKDRTSYAIRYRKIIKNEDLRYFEFRVSTADIDENGKIISIVIAFIDCNDEILHEMEYMKSLEKALKSDAVITGLTGDFDWVAYVANADGKDGASVTTYSTSDMFKRRITNWEYEKNYNAMLSQLCYTLVFHEDRRMFLKETSKNQIRKHLINGMAYYINFRLVNEENEIIYYQLKFVADIADGKMFGFIIGLHNVDEEIRREKEEQEKLEQMVEERTAQLEEKNKSLNRMNNDIIELMGNVVEGRDAESGQHVRRVKDFTNILATQVMMDKPSYGLTPELVEIITSASALHDVGKITISDSILLKPGRLTNEEFEIMKSHTVNGCNILDKMPTDWDPLYMKTSMDICRYHHEKYDGKGYPDGLKGDEIPISAQIVSIADCYDALVSKRVYKDAFSCDEAYNMIRNGECGMFNPELMECFASCKDKFEDQVKLSRYE